MDSVRKTWGSCNSILASLPGAPQDGEGPGNGRDHRAPSVAPRARAMICSADNLPRPRGFAASASMPTGSALSCSPGWPRASRGSLFGGAGSVPKTVAGTLVLYTLTNGFNILNLGANYQGSIEGTVLIAAAAVYTLGAQPRRERGLL